MLRFTSNGPDRQEVAAVRAARRVLTVVALAAIGLWPSVASAATCTVYDPNVNGGASAGVVAVDRTGTSTRVSVNPSATPSPSVTTPTVTSPPPSCTL